MNTIYNWNKNKNIKKRNLSDPIIYSHFFLVISAILSTYYINISLIVLTYPLIFLSFFYHLSNEILFCEAECLLAHLLFIYSSIQILYAPFFLLILTEIIFCISIIFIFIYLSFNPKYYNKYHTCQHIIASIWISLIAIYH